MQARLEVDGFRDAAVGIPEGDWGDILPPAVMAQREIAEGDLAAIGMAWQMDREKLDSAIVKQRRRLKPLDDETVRLAKDLEATEKQFNESVKRLDSELRDEHQARGVTYEDMQRRFEGRFSGRDVVFFLLLFILALGEFPLNEIVFEALEKTGLATDRTGVFAAIYSAIPWLVAFMIGVGLVYAAHFVGTSLKEFVNGWETNVYQAIRVRERLDSTDPESPEFARIERQWNSISATHSASKKSAGAAEHGGEMRAMVGKVTKAKAAVPVVIALLAFLSAFLLAYGRNEYIASERSRSVAAAKEDARVECLEEIKTAVRLQRTPVNTPEQCDDLADQAEASARSTLLQTGKWQQIIMFTTIQVLIFVVAAALSFHHHNSMVAMLKPGWQALAKRRRKFKHAQRRLARKKARLSALEATRKARFAFRRDQAIDAAKAYRGSLLYYYVSNLQNRPDAREHAAELASQPFPIVRYPGWLFGNSAYEADTDDRYFVEFLGDGVGQFAPSTLTLVGVPEDGPRVPSEPTEVPDRAEGIPDEFIDLTGVGLAPSWPEHSDLGSGDPLDNTGRGIQGDESSTDSAIGGV